MKEYMITLVAISEKKVKVDAPDYASAIALAQKMYRKTNALDFTNDDVTDVSYFGLDASETISEDT